MKSCEAIPVLKTRWAKLERHYTNLLEDFEVEEIHQFRLNVKKLAAFLLLLNGEKRGSGELKIGKKLRAFYRVAGNLRNQRLHRELVLRLCSQLHLASPRNYLEALKCRERENKDAVRDMALKSFLCKRYQKLIARAPTHVSEQAIENFVAENKHRLMKLLLAETYDAQSLHSVRKLLKHFLYLWPWVETEMACRLHSNCMNKSACLQLCEMLGDFLDCCTALSYFEENGATVHSHAVEAATLLALSTYVQNEKLRLMKEITDKLQGFVEKRWKKEDLQSIYEYS